ncbi:MAG: hypothetical protein RBR38_11550 [Desulfomicrobium apsheronum]|nr:hypothetical protein [Desulfomicrobium apsheronum]
MNNKTILYRQIHPKFIQNGRVTSQAFRPTPKDENKLSVYDGDMIKPYDSFLHYTAELNLSSQGVMGIATVECESCGLTVTPDPEEFQEHVLIDYSSFSNGRTTQISKELRNYAESRDWLFRIENHNQ